MSLGNYRRPLITSLLAISLNAGCSSPTSPAAPAPAPVVALTLTAVSPSRGLSADEIAISGTGFGAGAGTTVTFDGVPAKLKRVASITATTTTIIVTTPFHAAGLVDVALTTTAGTVTLRDAFTYEVVSLTATPTRVQAGGALTMSWEAPSGRGCNGGGDWIAIYKIGAPDFTGASNGHSDLWYTHVCGAITGTSTLNAPTEPGEYEFRYLVGDTSVARSNPVAVIAGN